MAGRDTVLSVGIIALIAGFGAGQFTPALFTAADDHHHGNAGHSHSADHHEMRDYGADAPEVSLNVVAHAGGGYAVQINAPGFRFAPENADKAHVPGEGHAHLYLDGEKVARIYAPWFHLPDPGEGSHEIKVTLNANDHGALMAGGQPLEATATLTQPE